MMRRASPQHLTTFSWNTPDLQTQVTEMVGKLQVVLPGYMVPTVLIPMCFMPFGTSHKLDSKTLKQ